MSQEPKSLQYFSILLRWKRFIVINFIIVSVVALVISLLLPKYYKATASLLPPKQPDIFGSLGASGSLLKGLGGLGKLGGLGQKSSVYNYFAILHSRTTMENVVRKFGLISVYDISDSSMEKTIKALEANVAFEEQSDDNITVEVFDRDPSRAAEMANYFVAVLNEVSIRLGTQEARNNREFVESRVNEARLALRLAEDSLRRFQEESGLIISPEQTSGVDAVATLYGMKVKKEIEVAIMKHSVSTDNSSLQQVRAELAELDKKVSTLPKIGIASLRLYRDVIVQQKILEFLIPLYEQAKIDERKDLPVLLVLDKAVPPERKSKPQRALIVLFASFFALSISILLAFMFHGIAKINGDANELTRKLRDWVARIRRIYRIRE